MSHMSLASHAICWKVIAIDNAYLLKRFNEKNIAVSLKILDEKTVIDLIAHTNYWKLGILIDVRCYVDDLAADSRLFDELRYWLILSHDMPNVLRTIDDTSFGISTNFVIAVTSFDGSGYELYDVYNLFKDRNENTRIMFYGNWYEKGGLHVVRSLQNKIARRSNLNHVNQRAMFYKCAHKPPEMQLEDYLDDFTHRTWDARAKFSFNILRHLSDLYNFTLSISESEKWPEGDRLGPMLRALINKTIDFTGTTLTMDIQRTYLMKFVHQDWPFRTCFIFRNPQPKNLKVGELLRPLSMKTWVLTGITLFAFVYFLALLLRYETSDRTWINYSNSILSVIGALCQQSTNEHLNHPSTRIVYLFLMVFSLLMYNYYSASIVSVRLNEPIFKIKNSLFEMTNLNLKMSSEWMSYLQYFLEHGDVEVKKFVSNKWSQIPEKQRYVEPDQALLMVQKGGYAYHTHPEVAYAYIDKLYTHRENCELMEVDLARPHYTSFAVTFNSSIEELARIGLTKITEVGLRNRQLSKWVYKKPPCRNDILSATSINIYEFAPHLLLLVIGINKYNEVSMNMYAQTKYHRLGIFFDVRCYDTKIIKTKFLEANELRIFGELHHWLILGSNLSRILDIIEDEAFGTSTDFVVAIPSARNDSFILYDVYNLFKNLGEKLKVISLGHWFEEKNIVIRLNQSKIIRRSNMHQISIRAMLYKCAHRPNGTALEEYLGDYNALNSWDAQHRFAYFVLQYLSVLYNFTLNLIESKMWEAGDALGPIVRALINDSIDITGSPISMSEKRVNVSKFVHQDWPFRTCFIFRSPPKINIKTQELLRPLSTDVWCLTIVLLTVEVILYTIILRYDGTESIFIRFSDSLLTTIASVCQQSSDVAMNSLSTRICYIFLLLFSLLFYNFYSASIVSSRFGEPIYKINNSLNEMSKLNLKLSSEWTVYLPYFFKYKDWEVQEFYKNIWQHIPEKHRFMSPEQGMDLVQKGGFAYHTQPEVAYPLINRLYNHRETCELTEVDLSRFNVAAFAVTLNSSIVETMRIGLTKIAEIGLRQRQLTRWLHRKPHCRKDILTASSVNMYEFAPHLVLLGIGMILALVACIVEILISNRIVSARLKEPIFKINNSLNEFSKLNLQMASENMIYLEFFLKVLDIRIAYHHRNLYAF
uniref:Ionotropic glutamate receptor C-terminal domain-containing protein n=1 Tax=Trichogramma kaykai TaxID=54128 RepID=A0ABD2W8I6_9HYME